MSEKKKQRNLEGKRKMRNYYHEQMIKEALSDFFSFLPQSILRDWLTEISRGIGRGLDFRGAAPIIISDAGAKTGQKILSVLLQDKRLKELFSKKRNTKIWSNFLNSSLEDKNAAQKMKQALMKDLKKGIQIRDKALNVVSAAPPFRSKRMEISYIKAVLKKINDTSTIRGGGKASAQDHAKLLKRARGQ